MFLILQGSKVDNKTGSPSWVLSPKAALVRQENQEGACAASRAQGTEVRKAQRSARPLRAGRSEQSAEEGQEARARSPGRPGPQRERAAGMAEARPGLAGLQLSALPDHSPLLQPSLAPLGDGRVLAAMRDRRRRWVHVSTWSPGRPAWSAAAATNLANPGSAVEAFSDRPGRIVLIYNPGRRDRRTLSLAFSLDGMRFARGCDLAAEGRWGQAAYPAVAEIGPGRWGVLFSVEGKREMAFAVLDRAFLDACAGDAGLPGISPG